MRGLKSLGISAESYGNLLFSILINKLPQELRLIISREIRHEEWEIGQLMEIIEREIDAQERASSLVTQPRSSIRDLPTVTSIASSDSCTPRCCYCKQSHSSTSCRTVTDVAQRKQILKKTGRCYVCFKRYHMSQLLMCSHCKLAIYNTFRISALICHIEFIRKFPMIIGKRHTPKYNL